MNTKPPECYAIDPNARAIRVELSPEQSMLLPFDQFVFSELSTEGEEQRLRLVFATHEVDVRGTALRRLETCAQRMELSHLQCASPRHESLVPIGQPMIHEITVTGVRKPGRGEEIHRGSEQAPE